jgi:glycosyltransferase involved in cell wall biosynthesis
MPVYNAVPFLDECMQGVLQQSLEDIEVICVNDGSTDGTLAALQAYAAADKRIRVLNKENGGYGHAMNKGIELAVGEYLGIVEPDDIVNTNMYAELYAMAKKENLDFVRSDYMPFWTGSDGKKVFGYERISDDDRLYGCVLNPQTNPNLYRVKMENWTGLYRNDFVKKHEMRFNESPGASYQDNGFWFQTYCWATRIAYINKAYYCYRQDNSASSINQSNKVFAMLDEYMWIRTFVDSHPNHKETWLPIYHLAKFFNCMFSLSLLSEELQPVFLERFSIECKQAIDAGELNKKLFYPDEWKTYNSIAVDWQAFLLEYRQKAPERDKDLQRHREHIVARQSGSSALFRYHLRYDGLPKTAVYSLRKVINSLRGR